MKVRTMAAKVVHLGDQLETANKKKNRTEEALQLIKYFNIFQRNEENDTKLFSNTSQALYFKYTCVVVYRSLLIGIRGSKSSRHINLLCY